MKKVSIILPSTGRVKQLKSCMEMIYETTKGLDVEVIAVVDVDKVDLSFAEEIIDYSPVLRGLPKSYNDGLKLATGEILIPFCDDFVPFPNWLNFAIGALNTLPEQCGVVGMNDLLRQGGEPFTTTMLMTRDYAIKYQGGVLVCPKYWSAYLDNEICDRAKLLGRYVYCAEAIIEHRHWTVGKSERDATYHLSDGWGKDTPVYEMRKHAGFPIDYEPVITS